MSDGCTEANEHYWRSPKSGATAPCRVRNGHIDQSSLPKQSFHTGAVRDTDASKVQLDLLPLEYLERVAWHYQNNIGRYGRDNWRKGLPARRCLQSLLRHVWAAARGKSDEDHLSAIVFNVFCIMHAQTEFKDDPTINDLPGYTHGQEGTSGPAQAQA
jgi:hypothetical protein